MMRARNSGISEPRSTQDRADHATNALPTITGGSEDPRHSSQGPRIVSTAPIATTPSLQSLI